MYPEDPICKIAFLLRIAGPKVLKENPKISNPYPNVDAISGALLSAAGFNHSEYFTLLFGMSRVVGIARQIVYERCEARGGKGTPIVRPKYIFKSMLE
jgi:citrate synthase